MFSPRLPPSRFRRTLTIWLDQPAKVFTESLPLGNGRLGAMDFGGVENERVALNEDSLWSGSVQNADRTNAAAALPEIRQLLLEGKNHEAESLVNRNVHLRRARFRQRPRRECAVWLVSSARRFAPEFSFTPTPMTRPATGANWICPTPRGARNFRAAA